MAKKKTLSKEEKYILDLGKYVSLPINTQILLTQSERDVLNTIRHLSNIGYTAISSSMLSVHTGLTDKPIKKAVDSLKRMKILKVLGICKDGTRYEIDYNVFTDAIYDLNHEFNPIERLRIADRFRGEGYELHSKMIERYTGTEFDNNTI